MKISRYVFMVLLTVYTYWVLNLPWWAGVLIVAVFTIPPVSIYSGMGLAFIYTGAGFIPIASVAMHVYTVVFAFSHNVLWKGIVTIFLPVISEVYWFVVDAQAEGFRKSIFCIILLWYIFGAIIVHLMPIFLRRSTEEQKSKTSE